MCQADLEIVHPDDSEYKKSKQKASPRSRINYKALANKINSEPAGTIIKITHLRGDSFNKDSITNIKRSLQARRLEFDKHYSLTFKTEEGQGVFYVTVKG